MDRNPIVWNPARSVFIRVRILRTPSLFPCSRVVLPNVLIVWFFLLWFFVLWHYFVPSPVVSFCPVRVLFIPFVLDLSWSRSLSLQMIPSIHIRHLLFWCYHRDIRFDVTVEYLCIMQLHRAYELFLTSQPRSHDFLIFSLIVSWLFRGSWVSLM